MYAFAFMNLIKTLNNEKKKSERLNMRYNLCVYERDERRWSLGRIS